jgi:hypothetical protein
VAYGTECSAGEMCCNGQELGLEHVGLLRHILSLHNWIRGLTGLPAGQSLNDVAGADFFF